MPTILHVTDMQYDFGDENGVLAVPGGADVARRLNDFFDALPAGVFNKAIFTYDTHPWFSYYSSPETIPFPAIHCEQGQKGWELVVDPLKLEGKTGVLFAPKETFDFWSDKATDNIDIYSHMGPSSVMGHAFFQKKHLDAGYTFLSRSASRDEFGAAVGHDFDLVGAAYTGKIKVYGCNAAKGKGQEGFYIKHDVNGQVDIIALADQRLIDVYNNVGRLTTDKECLQGRFMRDSLPKDMSDYKIVMTGLATNFCVFDAMRGYLERGAKVYALEDLMAGIPNGPDGQKALFDVTGVDRTASGDIRDVMQTKHFKQYTDSKQLVVMKASDFLVFANAHVNRPPNRRPFPKP